MAPRTLLVPEVPPLGDVRLHRISSELTRLEVRDASMGSSFDHRGLQAHDDVADSADDDGIKE